MSDIEYRAAFEGAELRAGGDGRTVDMFLVPYGKPTRINQTLTEQFPADAFEDQLRSLGRVPLAWGHLPHGGVTVGKLTELRQGNGGLVGTGRVSKTSAGDDLLALLTDGAIPGAVSIGFRSLADRKLPGNVTSRDKASLTEVAFVDKPAYADAQLVSVREADEATVYETLKCVEAMRRGIPRRLA